MHVLMKLAMAVALVLAATSTATAEDALARAKAVAAKYCPEAYKRAAELDPNTLANIPPNLAAVGYNMAVVRAKDCLRRSKGIRAAYLSAFTVDLMQGLTQYVDDVQANDIRREEDRLISKALSTRGIDHGLRDLLLGLQGQEAY